MLKVDLHSHTDDDPEDRISHSIVELIDHAASLGYGALAVTLHDRYFDPSAWASLAESRGIVLLSGIERTIAGRHVLLINFPPAAARVTSFEEVARLKTETNGLVIAPHPFYPTPSALGSALTQHRSVVDAVEINAMYTRHLDFNRRAVDWARAHGKPLVGNTDLHVLDQMGTTYSLVDSGADPDEICDAIRAGRVSVRTEPLSAARAAGILSRMFVSGLRGRVRRMMSRGQ